MVSLGKPIALGRTAEIYPWKEGQILKLSRDWVPADWVEYEARIARAVHAAGLHVPAAGEIVEVDGRLGLIYERVDGVSMAEIAKAKPWTLFRFARLLAELQADMHASPVVPELPSQRQRLENKIQTAKALPSHLKEAALSALAKMPDGAQLCHGDFHPDNILLTSQGPVIIDWVDATRGAPLADVARTSVLLLGAAACESSIGWLLKGLIHWFHPVYLKHYFRLRASKDRQQLSTWQSIVAAARLSENISEQQDWLLAQVKAGFDN